MSFLGGMIGNASRMDPAAASNEYRRLLADNEQVHAAYLLCATRSCSPTDASF